eukprot:8760360-Pyramimonas_sp.AAC.1
MAELTSRTRRSRSRPARLSCFSRLMRSSRFRMVAFTVCAASRPRTAATSIALLDQALRVQAVCPVALWQHFAEVTCSSSLGDGGRDGGGLRRAGAGRGGGARC